MNFKGILNTLKRVGKGIGDGFTGGAVSAVTAGIKSKDGGEGKVDYPKMIGYAAGIIAVIGVCAGWITVDDMKEIFKALTKFEFWS